jgi:hypothetical protein
VVLWRHHYKLSLRDLAEMFLHRGIVFTYEAVRDWERKLAPLLCVRAFALSPTAINPSPLSSDELFIRSGSPN